MKGYLIATSNIVMLYVAKFLLFFNCVKIPEIIIKQCKINNEYIEKECL